MNVIERIHQPPDTRNIRQNGLAHRAVQIHHLDRRAAGAQVDALAAHDQIVGGIAPRQRKRAARLRQRILDQRARDQHPIAVGCCARRQKDFARFGGAEAYAGTFQHGQ